MPVVMTDYLVTDEWSWSFEWAVVSRPCMGLRALIYGTVR